MRWGNHQPPQVAIVPSPTWPSGGRLGGILCRHVCLHAQPAGGRVPGSPVGHQVLWSEKLQNKEGPQNFKLLWLDEQFWLCVSWLIFISFDRWNSFKGSPNNWLLFVLIGYHFCMGYLGYNIYFKSSCFEQISAKTSLRYGDERAIPRFYSLACYEMFLLLWHERGYQWAQCSSFHWPWLVQECERS